MYTQTGMLQIVGQLTYNLVDIALMMKSKLHTFFYKNTLIFAEPQYCEDIFKSEPYFILKLAERARLCPEKLRKI